MSKRGKVRRHYWDSCTFIHLISGNEPDGGNILRTHSKAVDRGQLILVTSTFTLAEVVRPHGSTSSLSPSDEMKIRAAFKSSNIHNYELTVAIAERAREIQWECSKKIKPPDAIHMATAEYSEIDRFDTYDDTLIANAKGISNSFWKHNFEIGHPKLDQFELNV